MDASKTYLLTGASSGIGYAAALALARQGARVVTVSRPGRGAAKAEAIRQESGNPEVHFLPADLSSLSDVRRLAAEVRTRFPDLDVLVNNAGVYLAKRRVSVDGLELTFAVNHLAPFLLSNLLLEGLLERPDARIVTVSSDAARVGRLHEDVMLGQGYSGWRAYAQSKLANLLFTAALSRRLAGTSVGATALHPGSVATGFAQDGGGLMGTVFKLLAPVLKTPEQGARTLLYAASSPELAGVSGEYFKNERAAGMPANALDASAQARLWALSETLTDHRSSLPLEEAA